MARRQIPNPTERELSILRALWRCGNSTVRQVQEELNRKEKTGYTTVLKLLQIMTVKGLVIRDESSRTHVYRPKLGEEETQKRLLRDLLNRAFGGSAQRLVMQALSVKKVPEEELEEIKRMLEDMKG